MLSSDQRQTGSTVSESCLYPAKASALRRAADSRSLYVGLRLSTERKKKGANLISWDEAEAGGAERR